MKSDNAGKTPCDECGLLFAYEDVCFPSEGERICYMCADSMTVWEWSKK